MYFATVILLLVVFPGASVVIEAICAPHPAGFIPLVGKWFVFWGLGIRLFLAGARQVIQPRFTAEEIFRIRGTESLAIVRELGFANLSMGTLGTYTLFHTAWTESAAIVGGLYYGFAALGHIRQADKNAKEYIAMISDAFIFLVLSAFLSSELL
jgi:hypothetical protein